MRKALADGRSLTIGQLAEAARISQLAATQTVAVTELADGDWSDVVAGTRGLPASAVSLAHCPSAVAH